MLNHNYSKYFFILSIFIFITTVTCDPITIAPTTKTVKKFVNATNLLKLSTEKYQNTFCPSFDTVLADVDVIFNDLSKLTTRHVNALEQLERAGKKIILYKSTMDNDVSMYKDVLVNELNKLSYTKPIEILSPVTAIKAHFTKIGLTGKAYVIGDDDFQNFVKTLGIKIIHSPDSMTYDDYNAGCKNTLDSEVQSVIIGFDLNLNLYKLVQAFRYLNETKAKLFMTRPKSICGQKFHRAWIKYLVEKAKRTEQYIDMDGVFGDYLVEQIELDKKVLAIPSEDPHTLNFIAKHKFETLLIGKNIKIWANDPIPKTFYSIDDFGSMSNCPVK